MNSVSLPQNLGNSRPWSLPRSVRKFIAPLSIAAIGTFAAVNQASADDLSPLAQTISPITQTAGTVLHSDMPPLLSSLLPSTLPTIKQQPTTPQGASLSAPAQEQTASPADPSAPLPPVKINGLRYGWSRTADGGTYYLVLDDDQKIDDTKSVIEGATIIRNGNIDTITSARKKFLITSTHQPGLFQLHCWHTSE